MNENTLFDDSHEPNSKNLKLGDALGNDEQLRSFLKYLAKQANDVAPKNNLSQAKGLLEWVSGSFGFLTSKPIDTLVWIKKRFTDYELKQAQKKKIDTESTLNRAKSKIMKRESDAKIGLLEVKKQAIHSDTLLKKISKLEELGIGWYAVHDEDGNVVDIGFTKKQDPDDDIDPETPSPK